MAELALCPRTSVIDAMKVGILRPVYVPRVIECIQTPAHPEDYKYSQDIKRLNTQKLSDAEHMREIVFRYTPRVVRFMNRNKGQGFTIKELCKKIKFFDISRCDREQMHKIIAKLDIDNITLICRPVLNESGEEELISGTFYYMKEPDYACLFSLIE